MLRTTSRTKSVEKTITVVEGSTIHGLYWTQVCAWTALRLYLLIISSMKIESCHWGRFRKWFKAVGGINASTIGRVSDTWPYTILVSPHAPAHKIA